MGRGFIARGLSVLSGVLRLFFWLLFLAWLYGHLWTDRTLIGQYLFWFGPIVLIAAADAISGARPGARRESLEIYIKRLEALERIANQFPGVEKSYAIQAGREVRIMVEHSKVDDARAQGLASEIARRIEKELQYPGQIRVTVIRETRAVEYAK